MAAFVYQALDAKGRQKKGVLEADSARQIRQQLREKGWMPLSVEQTTVKQKDRGFFDRGPSLSVSERALLTRQLATLIGAGLPIDESLKALADQTEKQKSKAMVLAIRAKVLEGFTLAKALEEYPRAFPLLFRSTVSAGEHSGNLAPVLVRLADYSERAHESAQKIRLAAIYPIILTFVALTVVVILLTYVVPDIVEVFIKNGQDLPGLTQSMLDLSYFITNYGIYFAALMFAAFVVFLQFMRKPSFRKRVHLTLLRAPFLGKFVKETNTARFGSTLAILTSSGVPLVEGMRIASNVVLNIPVNEALTTATARVSEGSSLHKALHESGFFSPIMLHMIASGESSGELDSMLARTAEQQEKGLENTVTGLVSIFEPVMLLVMGGIVATIVVAILLPILQLQQMIQ